jgi:hypothetical protein
VSAVLWFTAGFAAGAVVAAVVILKLVEALESRNPWL